MKNLIKCWKESNLNIKEKYSNFWKIKNHFTELKNNI
jgi:hypothetical protein